MEGKEIESMPRCRTCNNLTPEGLPLRKRPSAYKHYLQKAFEIEKEPKEFEDSAALGCAACDVILQAIQRYINTTGSMPSSRSTQSSTICLWGNCNEPLSVFFNIGTSSGSFEIFEERRHFQEDYASMYPAIGFGGTPPESLDIDVAARLASQWLSRCVQQHGCTGDDEPLLPSRVLDLASGSVKLAIPAPSSTGCYAALSYCWGRAGNLITTSSNLDKRMVGIAWDEIPNLIQDVIRITRRLGIRYLWVDALCVIQDDAVDWRRESSKMGAVYAGAYVTIAADAATDTSCRLTSQRNSHLDSFFFNYTRRPSPDDIRRFRARKRIEVFPPLVVDGLPRSLCVREPWSHKEIVQDASDINPFQFASPLNMRGWVLQERLFSSRTLHFSDNEMVWECKESLNCECEGILRDFVPTRREESLKASFETAKAMISKIDTTTFLPSWATSGRVLPHEEFVTIWSRLVEAFSARRLTVESDRLPAISALARQFSSGRTYLAGLWADDLPWSLCWSVEGRVSYSRSMYSGPTWSWASTQQEVSWPWGTSRPRSRVQILEASTAPMSFNEFGEVAWGNIRLRAPVGAAKLIEKSSHEYHLVTSRGDHLHIRPDVGPGDAKSRSNQRTVYNVTGHEDLWCILLFDNALDDDRYRRISRSIWVMVAAKPYERSVQRARLDPNVHKDRIICERIGHLDRVTLDWADDPEIIVNWIDSGEFEEKEVILI